jgi:hypothetical protein
LESSSGAIVEKDQPDVFSNNSWAYECRQGSGVELLRVTFVRAVLRRVRGGKATGRTGTSGTKNETYVFPGGSPIPTATSTTLSLGAVAAIR